MPRYFLIPRPLVDRIREHLPPDLAHDLDSSLHLTDARPYDDLAADPKRAPALKLLNDPGYALNVPALRRAVNAPSEGNTVLATARANPRALISTLLLYADAGAPPPLPAAPEKG